MNNAPAEGEYIISLCTKDWYIK